MMESLARLLEVDVRFRMERSLTMVVGLSGERYSSEERQGVFFGQALSINNSTRRKLSVEVLIGYVTPWHTAAQARIVNASS